MKRDTSFHVPPGKCGPRLHFGRAGDDDRDGCAFGVGELAEVCADINLVAVQYRRVIRLVITEHVVRLVHCPGHKLFDG